MQNVHVFATSFSYFANDNLEVKQDVSFYRILAVMDHAGLLAAKSFSSF